MVLLIKRDKRPLSVEATSRSQRESWSGESVGLGSIGLGSLLNDLGQVQGMLSSQNEWKKINQMGPIQFIFHRCQMNDQNSE